jgi:hypothetical protein
VTNGLTTQFLNQGGSEMLKRILLVVCMGGCIGVALTISIMVILSWWGGPIGSVTVTFNSYHERIIETILFPLWALGGLAGMISLIISRKNSTTA